MKTWCYDNPVYDGEELVGNEIVEVTEDEIIQDYWPWWRAAMVEKFGLDYPEITKQNCIEDWVIVNWAWEKRDTPA